MPPPKPPARAVEVRDAIARSFDRADIEEGTQVVAISIRWRGSPRYQALRNLAEGVRDALQRTVAAGLPVVLVFANDVGKAVGAILGRELGVQGDLISIDGIALEEFDFIDIGEVLDAAAVVPVVVKSLIFPGDRAAAAAELEVQATEGSGGVTSFTLDNQTLTVQVILNRS